MTSTHRPSPLRLSDTTWTTNGIVDPSFSSSTASTSSLDLVPAPRASDLQMVLRTRDHAAYYDAASNELSLQKRSHPLQDDAGSNSTSHDQAPLVPRQAPQSALQRLRRAEPLQSTRGEAVCPTCARSWPIGDPETLEARFDQRFPSSSAEHEPPCFIAPNYFRLLAQASTTPDTNSFPERPATPRNRFSSASGTSTPLPSGASTPPEPISNSCSAQGYYSRFFIELKPLGRGARGQVFLCQHVLNGNKLGKYAIKKIPVGDHAQSLLQSLNEVHLMESLHHENLIGYQHAWIESCQLTRWGPEVPTLFVLMMAANGGSLADWISRRAGEEVEGEADTGTSEDDKLNAGARGEQEKSKHEQGAVSPAERAKIERLKAALRQRRANRTSCSTTAQPRAPTLGRAPRSAPLSSGTAIHLLRTDEIYSLLKDIVSGLSFLHLRGILHLDIKPGNILLHWDDDALIPRAMLSDFGSSLLLHDNWTRVRSGHTGTMEYMSPEAVMVNPSTGKLDELGSKSDIWSVGMILHLLVFFRLPWGNMDDLGALRVEIARYQGFRRKEGVVESEKGNKGDEVLLGLLEQMLQVDAVKRPSCKDVLHVLAGAAQKASRDEASNKIHRRNRDEKSGSLALYRASALPPLPHALSSSDEREFATAARTIPPLGTLTLRSHRLPAETLNVVIAFFKIVSPHSAAVLFASSSAPAGSHAFKMDALALLILALALVDLATAGTRPHHIRRRINVVCGVAHLVLLFACVVKRVYRR